MTLGDLISNMIIVFGCYGAVIITAAIVIFVYERIKGIDGEFPKHK